jgi:PD-(D/E)XK nuclease superfamily
MHPLYEKADKLSSEVIGAAIEVHRHKGPGLIESIYERCMLRGVGTALDSCDDAKTGACGV